MLNPASLKKTVARPDVSFVSLTVNTGNSRLTGYVERCLSNDCMSALSLASSCIMSYEYRIASESICWGLLPAASIVNSNGWAGRGVLSTSQSLQGRSKNLPKAFTHIMVPVAFPSMEYPAT